VRVHLNPRDIVSLMLVWYLVRVQRLKDARSEAAKEIELYKKAKEEEYKKFEGDVSLSLPMVRIISLNSNAVVNYSGKGQPKHHNLR
jgi:hypothetical protein